MMAIWKTISPDFAEIDSVLANFSLPSFHNESDVSAYVAHFNLEDVCNGPDADRSEEKPFEPDYSDLARLHYLVLRRKVLTTLEFGSGCSTSVIADAHRILKEHFGDWASSNVRVDNPFHVYSIEEDKHYLEITKARLSGELSRHASLQYSSVEIILHDNRIATVYSRLPNVSPDFIYLDGPSQFATNAEIGGFSLAHQSRMPMSADILRFEFFLEPGTLILIDGRTANARFLKTYLKRNWSYLHDPIGDVHYFELNEEPLGKFNKVKLDFCLNGECLLA